MSLKLKVPIFPFILFLKEKLLIEFIDPYPETDGIHYGATEAKAWAENVAKDFLDYAGVEAVVLCRVAPSALSTVTSRYMCISMVQEGRLRELV